MPLVGLRGPLLVVAVVVLLMLVFPGRSPGGLGRRGCCRCGPRGPSGSGPPLVPIIEPAIDGLWLALVLET